MSQTKHGSIKAVNTINKRFGVTSDGRSVYFATIGRTGGLAKVPKGFAMNRGLAARAGRLGGRSKIVLTQEQKEPINKLMQSGKSIYYISTKLGIGYNIVKRHFNNLKGEQ